MIKIKNIEITQEMPDTNINIDVLDSVGNVEYTYYVPKEKIITFLKEYEKENNII